MKIGEYLKKKKKIRAIFFLAMKRYSPTKCTQLGNAKQIDMGATDAWCFFYNMSGKTAAPFSRLTREKHTQSPIHLFFWETWKRNLNIKKKKILTAAVSCESMETDT